jgi:hypothetical protein
MPAVNVDKRFNHLTKMFRGRELPSMLDITVKQRSPLQGFEQGFPVLEAASVRIVTRGNAAAPGPDAVPDM